LALKHPDKIKGVVLLAGAAKMVVLDTAYATYYGTPEKRVATIDRYMAPLWFKTVTRETWDDNNFIPQDYAVHPVRGLRLWREAASPLLHVWVRYLCEFNAQDLSTDMGQVAVSTLLLRPGLEGLWFDSGQNYMEAYCHTSWDGAVENNPKVTVKTIANSRVCMWFDQPEKVHEVVALFLKSIQ
jgi:pimeloyl-ACP methyl ester carboxylesterase